MSQPSTARRAALIAAALIVLVIAGAITFILIGPDPAKNPALASAHSPMAGDAKAPGPRGRVPRPRPARPARSSIRT
jgi:hypothetical protein